MWRLVQQNLRHVFRSRLVFLVLVVSFVIHFLGLRILHHLTLSVQGVITTVGPKQAVFVSLFFQLFLGTFLAAIYGIWMMPYAHQGGRGLLTFTLPISKWKFGWAYSLTFFFLLLLEYLVLFVGFGSEFGWGALAPETFPWTAVLICLALEAIAFETVLFAFADASLWLGQVPTFFLGILVFFLLQIGGTAAHFGFDQWATQRAGSLSWIFAIYRKLPPVGELVFDLRSDNFRLVDRHFALWAIWFIVFVLIFRWKLRYPSRLRSTEV